MRIYTDIKPLVKKIDGIKKENKTISFVPTMGFLHRGHLSLIRKARKDTDCVVVSIFVNPIQFGPGEDFREYPRDLNRDLKLCRNEEVDIVFNPSVNAMYGDGFSTYVNVASLTDGLCGTSRAGHFRGVTTVVAKLFNIVRPDMAYFGQKDAQQAIVIKKMVEDLGMPIKIRIMPIIRERDGVAMSSRNLYLNPDERRQALSLYESLKLAKSLYRKGERESKNIIRMMQKELLKAPKVKIDYVSIVDMKELKGIKRISGKALAAVAVKIGKSRLIDNIILHELPRIKSQITTNL